MDPFGFILTDVLLHGLNGVFVFLLLHRLRYGWSAAACAAGLFVVHPVQVEAVAWISQRKTLLAMLLSLSTMLLYVRYTDREGGARWRSYVSANVVFALALLAKSVAAILPAILVLYDLLIRRTRLHLRAHLDKIPFVLMAAAAIGLAVVSQRTGGGIASEYHGGSWYATALTMLPVFQAYLAKLLWPSDLSVVYSPAIRAEIGLDMALPVLSLATLALLPLVAGTRRREAAFWVGTFFIGLAPASQIVPLVTVMNDRYLYFPMLGVAGGAALVVDACGPRSRRIVLLVALAACAGLGAASAARARVWSDSVTLWKDAAAKNPGLAMAWYGLGLAHDNAGQHPEAVDAYRRAIALNPGYTEALYNLALVHVVSGQFREAQGPLTRLLRIDPDNRKGLLLLAHDHYFQGDFEEAARLYRVALQRRPGAPELLNYLSLAVAGAGDRARGEALFADALSHGGKRPRLLFERALIESMARREVAAVAMLDAALSAGFDDWQAVMNDPDLRYVRQRPPFADFLERHGRARPETPTTTGDRSSAP